MTIRDKVTPQFSRALLWRFSMAGLLLLSMILLAGLWFSGSHDTREAFQDGRRLLITLENGAIEGKQTSLETTDTPDAAKEVPAPIPVHSPDAAATSPAAAMGQAATSPAAVTENAASTPTQVTQESKNAPPSSPAAASDPAEPFVNSDVTDLMQNTQIKPAAVPLAEVKDFLVEKTDQGNLPIIGPKGVKPWNYYAKPYSHKGHLPTIAIMISGLGQNKIASDAAVRLPENFSLSFSPYAKDLVTWAHAARVAGHEILLDLPLEPSNFPASDPGPYGLLTGKGTVENNKRLQWLMSRIDGYVGFVSPLNESFSANGAAFKDLLDQLAARGLMMGVAREPPKNETKKILEDSKDPYVIADAIIDEDLSVTAIQARLLSLEKIASKRGFAVGIAQSFPLTMQQLSLWSADLEKNGFTLVPVTFITKLKFPAS